MNSLSTLHLLNSVSTLHLRVNETLEIIHDFLFWFKKKCADVAENGICTCIPVDMTRLVKRPSSNNWPHF